MPRWLIYTLLTMLLWGGWGLVSKPLSERLSPWQIQTFSVLGELPVIVLLLLSRNRMSGPDPRRAGALAFASGLVGSLGNVAYYQALALGGKAAAVTPLTALYPVVTIVLALGVLGERLNRTQGAGIVLSLAAIWFFNVGAGSSWVTPWLAIALVPISLWGIAALLQKMATTAGSTEWVTALFLAGALPVSLMAPVLIGFGAPTGAATWSLVLGIGLLYALGNLTLIFAYGAGGKASIVTPMAALYSVVTLPLAVLLLGERFGARESVGIALALLAAAALSFESSPSSTPNNSNQHEAPD